MDGKLYKHYNHFPMSEWRWPNFSPREMASKREGELKINYEAMDKLQALRSAIGRPLIITSAYRSPAHNKAVGGATGSKHLLAEAFDVRMDNHEPHSFEAYAQQAGFKGFGYYPKKGFMHIDLGPARSWGRHWPKPKNEIDLPEEPETFRTDHKTGATAGAAGGTAVSVALEAAPSLSGLLGNLAPAAQTIAVVVTAACIGYLIWKETR